MQNTDNSARFRAIYQQEIKRAGADKLLEFLFSKASDFETAPASTRYHGSHPGGLLEHSLNVYDSLTDYLARPRVQQLYGLSVSRETVAIVSLLHDLCKVNCYQERRRKVRDASGDWQNITVYEFEDRLPYGHGEKSVLLISDYMKLTREEAFAIRYHMGFTGPEEKRTIGEVFERYPLALALFTADMESTFCLEKGQLHF